MPRFTGRCLRLPDPCSTPQLPAHPHLPHPPPYNPGSNAQTLQPTPGGRAQPCEPAAASGMRTPRGGLGCPRVTALRADRARLHAEHARLQSRDVWRRGCRRRREDLPPGHPPTSLSLQGITSPRYGQVQERGHISRRLLPVFEWQPGGGSARADAAGAVGRAPADAPPLRHPCSDFRRVSRRTHSNSNACPG